MKQKLTRQDIFEIIWRHYVVEGQPYAVDYVAGTKWPEATDKNAKGHMSPNALVGKLPKNQHVDVAFLTGLQAAHHKATNFVFDNITNVEKVKNLYARAHRRVFRKTMKYFLIAFAMGYNLTIPSETATLAYDVRLAAKNKR